MRIQIPDRGFALSGTARRPLLPRLPSIQHQTLGFARHRSHACPGAGLVSVWVLPALYCEEEGPPRDVLSRR